MDYCAFNTIFTKSVPHIFEKIFFSLDYASYKSCCEVNKTWSDLLTSKSYILMARSVFQNDVERDEARLFYAVTRGHEEDVRRLLSYGILDVNSANNCFGETPLFNATRGPHDSINLVKILIEFGSDINKTDKFGRSPLHWAAGRGHNNIVKFLVDEGAEVNLMDQKGKNPLQHGAMAGYIDVVQTLLESGAQLNRADLYGLTPLARLKGHNHLARFF